MARKRREPWELDAEEESPPPPEPCWLCERPLGETIERHHPVPKSRGGREVVLLHPICHQKLHVEFTNAQLARIGMDRDQLLANDDIAAFLRWVEGKPADFHAPTRKKGR